LKQGSFGSGRWGGWDGWCGGDGVVHLLTNVNLTQANMQPPAHCGFCFKIRCNCIALQKSTAGRHAYGLPCQRLVINQRCHLLIQYGKLQQKCRNKIPEVGDCDPALGDFGQPYELYRSLTDGFYCLCISFRGIVHGPLPNEFMQP
jgi:hypothetical protein